MNRILLVEDNETVASVSVDLLTSFEYEVVLATTGEEMLVALYAAKTPFDVVVLDAMLPDIGCNEAVSAIRGRNFKGTIVIWTGAFETIPEKLDKPEFGEIRVVIKGNPMALLDVLAELTGNEAI